MSRFIEMHKLFYKYVSLYRVHIYLKVNRLPLIYETEFRISFFLILVKQVNNFFTFGKIET